MDQPREPGDRKKTSSTELSGEFDMIVNEINDFIAILEERGHKCEDKQPPTRTQIKEAEDSELRRDRVEAVVEPEVRSDFKDTVIEPEISEDSEDSELSVSPRNTVIHLEDTEYFPTEQDSNEPIYESFDDVKENDYEAIKGPPLKVRAVATANLIPQKPAIKPKPKHLNKMMDSNAQTRRVKALHNFKGTNNDEVRMT